MSSDETYADLWFTEKLACIYPDYNEATDDYEDAATFLPRLFEWLDDFCPGWAIHNAPYQPYHWHGSHEAQQAFYRETMLRLKHSGGHFRMATAEHLVLCMLTWPGSQAIPWYAESL